MSETVPNPYASPDPPPRPLDPAVVPAAPDPAQPGIRLEGFVSWDDIRGAMRLARARPQRVWHFAWLVLVAGMLSSLLLMRGESQLFPTVMIGIIAATVLLMAGVHWCLPHLLARQLHRRLREEPISYLVAEDCVQMFGRTSSTRVVWSAFEKYRSSPTTLLLYSGPGAFFILPRALCRDDADWPRLLELVQRHVAGDAQQPQLA